MDLLSVLLCSLASLFVFLFLFSCCTFDLLILLVTPITNSSVELDVRHQRDTLQQPHVEVGRPGAHEACHLGHPAATVCGWPPALNHPLESTSQPMSLTFSLRRLTDSTKGGYLGAAAPLPCPGPLSSSSESLCHGGQRVRRSTAARRRGHQRGARARLAMCGTER